MSYTFGCTYVANNEGHYICFRNIHELVESKTLRLHATDTDYLFITRDEEKISISLLDFLYAVENWYCEVLDEDEPNNLKGISRLIEHTYAIQRNPNDQEYYDYINKIFFEIVEDYNFFYAKDITVRAATL